MKLDSRFVVPAAIVALTLVGGPVSAQEQEQRAPSQSEVQAQESQESQDEAKTAQGELLRVDAETKMFWIKGADDKEQQFSYTEATEVTGEAENVEGLSGEAGTRVTVDYRSEGEKAVATKIAIHPEADAAAPSSPAPARQE